MELDPHANADLTAFFTKRFPSPEERAHLASAAKVTFREPPSDNPEVAWGGLLTRAREQSALPRLAHCAARKRPRDENLQGVAAILSGRQWPPPPRPKVSSSWKQAGALTALFAIAGVAWAARGPREDQPSVEDALAHETTDQAAAGSAQSAGLAAIPAPEPTETANVVAADEPVDVVAAARRADAPSAGPKGSAIQAEEPAPAEGSSAPPEVVPSPEPAVATAAPEPATGSTPAGGSCRGARGQLVGYWYAGTTSPGQKGDQIKIPRDLNVRADYPDRHNGYDRRAPIRCTLGVGQSLVLTADPIAVPGGAFWVPLYATGR